MKTPGVEGTPGAAGDVMPLHLHSQKDFIPIPLSRQGEIDLLIADLVTDLAEIEAARPVSPAMQAALDELDALLDEALAGTAGDASGKPENTSASDCKIASINSVENTSKTKAPLSFPVIGSERCAVSPQHPLHLPLSTPLPSPLSHPPITLSQRVLIPTTSHASLPLHAPSTGRPRKQGKRSRKLPTWERASARDRFRHALVTSEEHGGLALTLDLSGEVQRSLVVSDEPVRFMSRRIARAFKDAGLEALPYSFTLEISPEGKAHLHGSIIPGAASLGTVKRALMKAGGKMAGRSASRQVKLDPFSGAGAAGWDRYVMKTASRTERVFDRLTFLSDPLRRLARASWGERRIASVH